jgi:hypothetical protein
MVALYCMALLWVELEKITVIDIPKWEIMYSSVPGRRYWGILPLEILPKLEPGVSSYDPYPPMLLP